MSRSAVSPQSKYPAGSLGAYLEKKIEEAKQKLGRTFQHLAGFKTSYHPEMEAHILLFTKLLQSIDSGLLALPRSDAWKNSIDHGVDSIGDLPKDYLGTIKETTMKEKVANALESTLRMHSELSDQKPREAKVSKA